MVDPVLQHRSLVIPRPRAQVGSLHGLESVQPFGGPDYRRSVGFRVPGLIACLAAGVVSGCGWGELPGDNGPMSQREQIVALVERSFEAIANQDAATICQELIAPSQVPPGERC